mmetsp:Transcript_42640/g.54811  ORF Transcript_42640/g.54811 Transcript_42640/m.54811 type:complete len:97 (-) Transcript_42640:298-588(-)
MYHRKSVALKQLSAEDEDLLHCEFDDDGIAWKVIKVDYSMSEKEVMYWYYNIQQAREEDLSELEIEDALDEDPPRSLVPVERSRVSEVRDWLEDDG